MKAFTVFSLIAATLLHGSKVSQEIVTSDPLSIVPITPDEKVHEVALKNKDGTGSGSMKVLWAPKKFETKTSYTQESPDYGSVHMQEISFYYNDEGVGEDEVKKIARNLGSQFAQVIEVEQPVGEDPRVEELS